MRKQNNTGNRKTSVPQSIRVASDGAAIPKAKPSTLRPRRRYKNGGPKHVENHKNDAAIGSANSGAEPISLPPIHQFKNGGRMAVAGHAKWTTKPMSPSHDHSSTRSQRAIDIQMRDAAREDASTEAKPELQSHPRNSTRSPDAAREDAEERAKPVRPLHPRNSRHDHTLFEAHARNVVPEDAEISMEPKIRTHPQNLRHDHESAENHSRNVVPEDASHAVKPKVGARPRNSTRSRRRNDIQTPAAAREDAIDESKPILGARPRNSRTNGQLENDTHPNFAVVRDSQSSIEPQPRDTIPQLIELWKRRQAWHRAEKSLTLAASAYCRRICHARGIQKGMTKEEKAENKIRLKRAQDMLERIEKGAELLDKDDHDAANVVVALLMGREPIRNLRKAVEKPIEQLAEQLPVWQWCKPIRGIGPLALASLIGEAGDIGSYKSVGAVWKRFGLGLVDGIRQQRIKGDPIAAKAHGYSPSRRSVAWNVGACLLRSQNDTDYYKAYYNEEKLRQAGKLHKGEPLTKGHAHNRAMRHMTKRFLRELHLNWGKT
jgi:hypothetical protein